jgi:hypothetical protein
VSATRLSSTTTTEDRGPGARIYLAFVPWVLFTVIAQHSTLKAGALVALAGSVAIALPSLHAGRPKLLELGAILAFAGFAYAAFSTDASTAHFLARYARAIAAALLALIAFGSLIIGGFTAQYAREQVPPEFWSSHRFRQINRRLSLMWACVFCAMVPPHLIAGAIDTRKANLIFNWAIPMILLLWAAKRTAQLSEQRS